MIKVYALLPKRPDISEEQFQEHWRTVHREHALRIDRLRRYVQAHRIAQAVPGVAPAPYSGIPEVWYDSLASAVGQNDDPNYTEYAQRDEPNFIDMSGIRWVMTEHRPIHAAAPLDTDTPATKAILLVRRPKGAAIEQFQMRWWELSECLYSMVHGVFRTAAAVTLPETYRGDEPTYDAFAELWWPDRPSFEAGWGESGQDVLGAIGEVADLGRSNGFLCRELRVIWPSDDASNPAVPQNVG
jgi:uncharacterized protein (TIGR02118 family)